MIVKAVESITLAFAAMTAAVFNNLAIALAPLSPAIYSGHAVADMLEPQMGAWPALMVGVSFALGLESAGFKAFHLAIHEKGWQSKLLPVGYIVLGIAVVVSLKPDAAVLGVVMFLLVALVYSAEAARSAVVARKAEERFQKLSEAEDRQAELDAQHERESEAARLEADLRLAKLEAQKQVKLAEINAKLSTPAPESFQKVSETFPTDWRKLAPAHKAQLARMTEQQIAETVGVTTKTARAWLEKLA